MSFQPLAAVVAAVFDSLLDGDVGTYLLPARLGTLESLEPCDHLPDWEYHLAGAVVVVVAAADRGSFLACRTFPYYLVGPFDLAAAAG